MQKFSESQTVFHYSFLELGWLTWTWVPLRELEESCSKNGYLVKESSSLGGPGDPWGVSSSALQGDSEHQAEQLFWDLDKRVRNKVGTLAGEENKSGPWRWARDTTIEGNHGGKRTEGNSLYCLWLACSWTSFHSQVSLKSTSISESIFKWISVSHSKNNWTICSLCTVI